MAQTTDTALVYIADRIRSEHPDVAEPDVLAAWIVAVTAQWFVARMPGPEDVLGNGWNVQALQALGQACEQAVGMLTA